jgi:glycolate oxidase iron-sulfur subunit
LSHQALASVAEEIAKCMRCGNCQAVCPLYGATLREPMVARGKVHLGEALLRGEVPVTSLLADRCAACAVMPRPGLMHAGARLLSRLQGFVFRRRTLGMSPRFPVGLETRRVIPVLPRAAFRELRGEAIQAPTLALGAASETARVALFTGCLADYVYPDTALAAAGVLTAGGATVTAPRGQHCCGYPVISAGKVDLAREMARSHVRLFAARDVEAVITLCGTCGEAFIHHYPELLAGDRELGPAAASLASRTHDISRYLGSVRPLDPALLGPLDLAVTYHQPCHLGRGLGVEREPVDLLRAIPGITFTPLRQPERCCGGSGAFAFGHYELADRVRRCKLSDAAETVAAVIATGCSSCRMHLEEGLSQDGSSQRVLHTVELLYRSAAGTPLGVHFDGALGLLRHD